MYVGWFFCGHHQYCHQHYQPAEEGMVQGLIEASKGTKAAVPLHRSQPQLLLCVHISIQPPAFFCIFPVLSFFWKTWSTVPQGVLSNLQPPALLHLPNCFLTRPEPSNPDWPRKKTSPYTRLWGETIYIFLLKWLEISPQMYSMLSTFFWPFLQSELSSNGSLVDANDFIAIVVKEQEEFPLQRSCTYTHSTLLFHNEVFPEYDLKV